MLWVLAATALLALLLTGWLVARRIPLPPSTSEVPAQRTPPAGMGPALVGLVADRRVLPRHVLAMMLDLADRGFIRIEAGRRRWGGVDWQIYRLTQRGTLASYERRFLSAAFNGDHTSWRRLHRGRRRALMALTDDLEQFAVRKGWFDSPPARRGPTLNGWWLLGGLVAAIAAAVLVPGWGLIPAAAFLLAGALAGFHPTPAASLTPAGHRVRHEILGLMTQLSQNPTDEDRAANTLFPYAVALGLSDRWQADSPTRNLTITGFDSAAGKVIADSAAEAAVEVVLRGIIVAVIAVATRVFDGL